MKLPLALIRLALIFAAAAQLVRAQLPAALPPPTRAAHEPVGSAAVRERAGLLPSENLLFNGWGVTPAGAHVRVSDMALKMIVSPDKKMLVAPPWPQS